MKFRPNFCGRYWGTTSISSFLITLLLVPHISSAQVIISEVMYDAAGSDAKSEWVELQNIGSSTADISKWKINDGSNHVFNPPPKNGSTGSLSLSPQTYLILAGDAQTVMQKMPSLSVSVIDTVLSLGNDGGTITLFDQSGSVVDKVKYSRTKGADGTGDSLQKVNGKFVAATPTIGTPNTAKAAPPKAEKKSTGTATAAKKTTTSRNVASASVAHSDEPETQVVSVVATTVIPVIPPSKGPMNPWLYGALAICITAGAATLVAQKKRSGEWDIEEIPDDV